MRIDLWFLQILWIVNVSPSQIQIFDSFLVNIDLFPNNLILNSQSYVKFESKLICQSRFVAAEASRVHPPPQEMDDPVLVTSPSIPTPQDLAPQESTKEKSKLFLPLNLCIHLIKVNLQTELYCSL